ncbi:MAG: arsenite oxidase small subunit, partial [Hydrogenophaga sp.]|nr:arsenite oxidase small subunit [Hydrogenophaga sp.]
MEDVKIGRRFFLKSGGAAAAVAGATIIPIRNANAATLPASSGTTLPYPKKAVGSAKGMPLNQAVSFAYPDDSSACLAIRMGSPVPGGVGP